MSDPRVAQEISRMGRLTISTTTAGDVVVVALAGELDLATTGAATEALTAAAEAQAGPVTLDLSELEFIDSSGLAMLVTASARSGPTSSRLSMTRPRGAAWRVLEVSGMVDTFRWAD